MNFDEWFIVQFRDVLSEPLNTDDGICDTEIEASLNGLQIPLSIRAYFRVAGKHWLNTNYNEWLPLGGFEPAGDHTIFMNENQFVVRWAVRTAELIEDDPIVYQAQPDKDPLQWHSEKMPFSRFIIAMWKWVLTGESAS